MNDPHVSVLLYRVKHNETVNYDTAQPLDYEDPDFRLSVKDREARFVMKAHFASIEQARAAVQPFIRQWELTTALDRGPGEFELVFADAVVEDRNPTPGVVHVKAVRGMVIGDSVSMVVVRAYPQPPQGIAINADVAVMALRYAQYREGKDTLAGMAYFCLTVLEQAAGNRAAISAKYGIASTVIRKLGCLTGKKGGVEARKGGGRSNEFTPDERNWIDEAVKILIRRAAQVAHDHTATDPQITMAALPKL